MASVGALLVVVTGILALLVAFDQIPGTPRVLAGLVLLLCLAMLLPWLTRA